MDFFEKVGGVISTKGKAAADKAKSLAEIANMKGQIGSCEEVIKKNYLLLGKAYYEAHKEEDSEQVRAIADAERAITDLRKKILDIKGAQTCPACREAVPADSSYCPKCGARITSDEEDFQGPDDIILPKAPVAVSEDCPAREFMEERLLEEEFLGEDQR